MINIMADIRRGLDGADLVIDCHNQIVIASQFLR